MACVVNSINFVEEVIFTTNSVNNSLQEMTSKEYLDDQDAEEPDDYIISLTSLVNISSVFAYYNFPTISS